MQTRSHLRCCRELFWVGLAAFAVAAPAFAQKRKPAPPASEKPAPAPQPKPCPVQLSPEGTHRLIMKDGAYQSFSKCEVVGERVRYLSAERYEWEEIPKSLVDWEATTKYEQSRQAGERESARTTAAEEEAERRAQEARSPTVSPGVRLPEAGGVFLLDSFQGKPELVELSQNGGEINRERGRNVLRAALNPFAGSKQSIELKSARARVQVHVSQPVIYLNVEPAEASAAGSGESSGAEATAHAVPALANRYRIARLSRKKDSRVIGNLKVAFTGKLSQQQELVPSTAELLSPLWVKLAPLAPVPPGEYAVVEMLGEKGINLYVWDFGVDPAAPENSSVWREAPAPQADKDETPALTNRPKK